MTIIIDNDYTNINGELVPVEHYDSVDREDLIHAFNKFAPVPETAPTAKLGFGLISVAFLLVLIKIFGA